MRRGRTASFTGRLGLNIRSPLTAAENKLAVLLRFFEPPALSPSGEAARGWATGRTRKKKALLLRLFEPRSPPPPHAAGCNSSELVALIAGGELSVMGRCLCDPLGRAGRTPAHGRDAQRLFYPIAPPGRPSAQSSATWGSSSPLPPRAAPPFIPRGSATENRGHVSSCSRD